MKNYIKYEKTSSIDMVNKLKEDRWEVIETQKNICIDTHTETVYFILGYPVEEQVLKLQNIICYYEKLCVKDELFKHIAKEHKENYDEIEEGTVIFDEEITPTATSYKSMKNLYMEDK
ncbi:hypothetical protein ER45_030055 (plasmid) [Bacillus mycoides]|nr:hypothetical protein ER45_030055 [Bacillus mycoides]